MGQKIDTQAIGLDIGLSFVKWLTGAENLHYGLWDGLDVHAGNLRAAQDAYSDALFKLLPDTPCRILDIGGGAGETARKLLAMGHTVDIVVPSAFLASRCRETAAGATVHEMIFEDFRTDDKFDVCLFSESYQYIGLNDGLPKALTLLATGGQVIISDCFRREEYYANGDSTIVGGGHNIREFRELIASLPVTVHHETDITEATAPSVDIEQGLFNVVGFAGTRVDQALAAGKPKTRWIVQRLWRNLLSDRRRDRLNKRLYETLRNRDVFAQNNIYLMMCVRPQ
ncbi:MAG: class I SAM-dependent methyltransferase [Planktomarina sp.]